MKIRADVLRGAVVDAEKAVRDTRMDFTKLVAMERDGDFLQLFKHNGEVGYHASVPAMFADGEAFDAAVSASILAHVLGGIEGDVQVSADKNNVAIDGDNARARLAQASTGDPRDFWPRFGVEKFLLTHERDDIQPIISSLAQATYKEYGHAMSCIHLRGMGDKLILEASDSFRVAQTELACDGADEERVLVPAAPLVRAVGALDGELTFTLCRLDGHSSGWNYLQISDGQREALILCVQDATFPDMGAVRSRAVEKYKATIMADMVRDALAHCKPFTRTGELSPNVVISASEDSMTFSAEGEDGAYYTSIPCRYADALPYSIAVNGDYLMDALRLESDARLGFGENNVSPIFVHGDRVEWLIMPRFLRKDEREVKDDDEE